MCVPSTFIFEVNKMRKGLLCLFAIFCFLLKINFSYGVVMDFSYISLSMLGTSGGNPYISNPTTPSAIDYEDNIVSSGYEFLSWMDNHENLGGTVMLSCDISIYGRTSQEYFYPSKKIIIDTAGHSITVKKGTFVNLNGDYINGDYINGDSDENIFSIEVIGEGPNPIIILEDGGFLNLQYVKLKSDGTNSVAIYKKGGKMNVYGSSIEVSGEGCSGIISKDSLELENVNISASGTNSTAIMSGESISLFFGQICAYGSNSSAAITSGAAITIDTSYSCPEINNSIIIKRELSKDNYYSNIHIQTILNEQPQNIYDEISLKLSNIDDAHDFKEVWARTQWNMKDMDITKTGTYEITGKIIPLWDKVTIHGNPVLNMKIDVKDPSVPDISFITITRSSNKYFQSDFPAAIENTEDIILWKSDDNSDWYDYTDNCDFILGKKMIVYNVEPETPAYFKLEVMGNGDVKGISKTIKITIHKDKSCEVTVLGGDRDGGDRDGGSKNTRYSDVGSSENILDNTKKNMNVAIYVINGLREILNPYMFNSVSACIEPSVSEKSDEYNEEYSLELEEDNFMNSAVLYERENILENDGNNLKTIKHIQLSSSGEKIDDTKENSSSVNVSIETDNIRIQPETSVPYIDDAESKYEYDYVFLVIATLVLFFASSLITAIIKRKFLL